LLDSVKKIRTKAFHSGLIETRGFQLSSEASGWKITFIA
jgi:hypothetical protein